MKINFHIKKDRNYRQDLLLCLVREVDLKGNKGGSYPIPDESHARNALARVSQHGSEAEKAKVRKAVASKFPNIKIGESKETAEG